MSATFPRTTHDALLGTWHFAVDDEPPWVGLLHFTDTGRAIQFVFNAQQRIPMRLWYAVESATELRFRPAPDAEGWLRGYRFDGATMTLLAGELRFVCARPLPDEIPEWFQPALTAELAKS